MWTERLATAALLAALCGCGEDADDITIEAHGLEITVPSDWEHLDQGVEQTLRVGSARIVIRNMGVVTRAGYLEAVETAHELWRAGDAQGARARLHLLPVPRAPGYTREEHRELRRLWVMLTGAPTLSDPQRAEQAFARVRHAIRFLPEPQLEGLVRSTLEELGQRERRRIADQRRIVVGGRSALRVDTWDWLSHDHRKRFVLLFSRGHLLVIWTPIGRFEEVQKAYARVLDSLRVASPSVAPGGDAGADR